MFYTSFFLEDMSKDSAYYRLGLKIFIDLTGSIAIPAVLGAVIGKKLDTKYATAPRYLILLLALALVFTAILIVKKAKRYRDEYESINQKSVDKQI
jgi:F0F1-type ATP synthase assembly protein I